MKPVVEVDNYSFTYQDAETPAIKDVSLTLREGEFVCIVGANGAGKTTLCNALVGLIPHYFTGKSEGSVRINGADTADASVADLSNYIGLVFQNPFNQLTYASGTVAEELAYGLGNRGVSREEMRRRVKLVSQLMHIENLLERDPLELSGGQVQRVAFGSTFILEPNILVLDECTTQLDPLGASEIFDIVKQLNASGITVIMVDHDMERVARYADTVVVMERGQVRLAGGPREIFSTPGIERYGIDVPDYVKLSKGLARRGLSDGKLAITYDESLAMTKEVLEH
ncbi:ATP-binding cassette domain-containing protein [Bifidobacterium sp. ESL0784]|uniref:energy-coupling factor ABC transporter ATP-binding protein n=1 Tax=Bifidobacterium sp. ESL0784 TaxID=2983231 RepID=UPI0023F9A146|nr:ATP-binding cassette domain-containing protein [Bifidobacterium sp. ESL0784]MDF7640515.1 ATP-binding cassette domain-containing protein [Bifidobacterium sp. ESL0784]